MFRPALLALTLGGLLALQAPGVQAQDNDPVDVEHVSLDSAMSKLERRGYTDLVDATTNRFRGRWEIQATNPQGERVVVTVDNTNGEPLWEHPVR
jgi:polyisoprenoid-binding protein YceI